ncbi:MAG: hypothetical protein HY017_06915 [Betaproteobacteria bacterium]|nr:hypothetical protein [Betaproteobacteria bacterium]
MSAARAILTALLAGSAVLARAADPIELHGASDAFAAPGIAIAWGVLRGTTEDTTLVVLRIAADAKRFTHIAIAGVDPFTRRRELRLSGQATDSSVEMRTPRAGFADTPRTEVRLYASSAALRADSPELVVYFLSIPDTTPEFADSASLGAYLATRMATMGKP